MSQLGMPTGPTDITPGTRNAFSYSLVLNT